MHIDFDFSCLPLPANPRQSSVHKKWQYPRGLLAVIGPYTQYIVSETCIAICSIAQDVAFFVNSFIESLRGSLATNLSKFGLSAATGETRFYAIYTPGLYFYCLWRIFHFLSRGFERPPPPNANPHMLQFGGFVRLKYSALQPGQQPHGLWLIFRLYKVLSSYILQYTCLLLYTTVHLCFSCHTFTSLTDQK